MLALAAKPGDKAALACQVEAQRLFDDEQAYARGVAALANDDAVAAFEEFSLLSETSALRKKPQIQQAMAQYAAYELLEGRAVLATDPKQAEEAAETVLALDPLSEEDRAAAEQLLAEARAPRRGKPLAAGRQRLATNAGASGWVSPATRGAGGPAGFVAPTATAPAMAPMEAANLCLTRGDNPCVIRALSGKAKTEPELALLIETYRAMGNTAAAQKYMTVYVSRFPTGRRAQAYRAQLNREGSY